MAALEDLFGDDSLLKEFLHGLKDGDGDMKMDDYIDQFVEDNLDFPGMGLLL